MNADGPGSWVNRLTAWCFSILAGAVALYCAVKLIEAILPALIVTIGILTITGLLAGGGIVVFRTLRHRW